MGFMNQLGINTEALLKILSLLGFAFLFYVTIESGKAQYYVHPRIVPYMKFGAIVFVIISIFVSRELFKPKRKNIRIGRYLLFIIPLMLAFALPPKILDTDSMSLRSINGISSSSKSGDEELWEEVQAYNNEEFEQIADDESSQYVENNAVKEDKKLMMQDNTIVMEGEDFAPWITELYGNPDKYIDKNIQVVGFVFRDKAYKQNEFVPARLTMSCCAADLEPVGILCKYQQAEQLKKDDWVKVVGKVRTEEFEGQKYPVIIVESVESAEKPANEIVYFSY